MTAASLVAGLVLLIAGAETLVRGASRLARSANISPLVVGLTVVAFGTSSPELAVSIEAALSGQAGIAVGNVVGSNIFNVLFILGLSAMIVPLAVKAQLVRLDVPLMIALSCLVLLLSLDGGFRRIDGLLMVGGLACYIAFLIRHGRAEGNADPRTGEGGAGERASPWWVNLLLVGGGLLLLVLGSRWLVDGAVSIARYLGVGEVVIGLTLVAAGTSLPEVVTSILAAVRGERDIAVGNVVGSNIFNIMAVLGVAGIVAPSGIDMPPAVIRFDVPVMIVVAFACLPIFFTGGTISRAEGALLFAYYIAYTAYLVMAAGQHAALPHFSAVMLYFAVPLTLITLAAIGLIELRRRAS